MEQVFTYFSPRVTTFLMLLIIVTMYLLIRYWFISWREKQRSKSKWIPLGVYDHGVTHYIVFARINEKTGMMYFKSKILNPSVHKGLYFPNGLVDTRAQWMELTGTAPIDLGKYGYK